MEMRKERKIIIMATKNDERVLQLKEIIDKKKLELKGAKKFTPLTNCILDLEGAEIQSKCVTI